MCIICIALEHRAASPPPATLKREYLFIGGPHDGKRLLVDEKLERIYVPEEMPLVPVYNGAMQEETSPIYNKTNIGSTEEPEFIFAHCKLPRRGVIRILTQYYQPRG